MWTEVRELAGMVRDDYCQLGLLTEGAISTPCPMEAEEGQGEQQLWLKEAAA